MKIHQLYECEKCKKTSRNKEEIRLCEAKHMGLQTLEEKRKYEALEEIVRHCSFIVSRVSNEHTRKDWDDAIKKILKFEKDHNMIVN